MPTIAIDAMGGDFAPGEVVRAAARVSVDSEIRCVLVGDEPGLERALARCPHRREHLSIVHAGSAIAMGEEPRAAIREKLDCSLLVAAGLVASGGADAMVSAGNTGACVLACARTFRTIPGVRKTALASVFPRKIDEPGQDPLGLLLDVGAKAHGRSNAKAIANAIKVAAKAVRDDVPGEIGARVAAVSAVADRPGPPGGAA
ncbi:MAG: hypothetical protein HYY35_00565 [Deltaproteobacteria bacterium]|nr:hypothetical protein [Deltaproteobacteria bacterium]